MKNVSTILFLFSVLVPSLAFTQITAYYRQINHAEKYLVSHKPDSALYHYQQAEKYVKTPFAVDLYNAATIAVQQKNYELANRYLHKLIQLGAEVQILEENTVFNQYFTTNANGRAFAANAVFIKPLYDTVYRNQLQKLFEKDQYYRKKRGGKNQYADSIQLADKENIAEVLAFIKAKGFPSEARVGIDPKSYTMPYVDIVFIHQRRGPVQQYNFADLLLENVQSGDLRNVHGHDLYAMNMGLHQLDYMRFVLVKVIDSTKPSARSNNHIIIDSTQYGFMPYDITNVAKINSTRSLFYLAPYENYMKQILFNERFKYYLLSGMSTGISAVYTDRAGFEADKHKLITRVD